MDLQEFFKEPCPGQWGPATWLRVLPSLSSKEKFWVFHDPPETSCLTLLGFVLVLDEG